MKIRLRVLARARLSYAIIQARRHSTTAPVVFKYDPLWAARRPQASGGVQEGAVDLFYQICLNSVKTSLNFQNREV